MILQQLFCETLSTLASCSQKMLIGEVVCRSGSVASILIENCLFKWCIFLPKYIAGFHKQCPCIPSLNMPPASSLQMAAWGMPCVSKTLMLYSQLTRDKGHLSLLVLGVLLKVPLKLRDITHNKVCPLTILASWFGMMSRIHPSVYPQQVSEELFWAHLGKISIFCNSTVFPSLFFVFASCEPTCPPVGLTGPCWWTLRFYFLQPKQFCFSTNHGDSIYLVWLLYKSVLTRLPKCSRLWRVRKERFRSGHANPFLPLCAAHSSLLTWPKKEPWLLKPYLNLPTKWYVLLDLCSAVENFIPTCLNWELSCKGDNSAFQPGNESLSQWNSVLSRLLTPCIKPLRTDEM